MKTSFIFSLVLFFTFSTTANAIKIDTIPRTKTLSRIKLVNGKRVDGYIIDASDSSITLIKKKDWGRLRFTRTETMPAERISGVTKNFKQMTMGEGILAGGLGGLLLGFCIMLFTQCDDPDGDGNCDFEDKVFTAKSFRTYLVLTGGLGVIGMFIGLFSRKKQKMYYHIGGNRDNIKNNKIGLTF